MPIRKYNTATSAGTTSDTIRFGIYKAGSSTFATGSDWTPAAGDVKVSKNGSATFTNIATLPNHLANGIWSFTFSAAELQCVSLTVVVANAAITSFDFTIEISGNPSAMYPDDFTILRIPNAAADASTGLPTAATVAKLWGYKKTYFVRSADGNDSNDGLCPATAKLTIASALALATAGDAVLAVGTYTPAATLTIPAGVTLMGPDPKNRTLLTISGTTINAGAGGPVVSFGGDGVSLQACYINAGGDAAFPFGKASGGAAPKRLRVEDVTMIGGIDCIILNNFTSGGGDAYFGNVDLFSRPFTTTGGVADCLLADGNTSLTFERCRGYSSGQRQDNPALYISAVVLDGTPNLRAIDCVFEATADAGTSALAVIASGASGNFVELIECALYASAGTAYDVVNGLNGLVIARDCKGSGAGGALQTTGTVTLMNSQATVGTLATQAKTDVQSALTSQGYTTGRAPNLDNLNATISSRATPADISSSISATFPIIVISPATPQHLDLFRADAYKGSQSTARSLLFNYQSGEPWPDTITTADFYCAPTRQTLDAVPAAASLGPISCTVVQATGPSRSVRIDLTGAQLASLTSSTDGISGYRFWIIANRAGDQATLRSGTMRISPDPTAPV